VRGEPLALLWASEDTIYGRFGYGMASQCAEVTIPRQHSGFARPFEREGRVRLVDSAEALEAALDACETTANVLGNIVVKNQ